MGELNLFQGIKQYNKLYGVKSSLNLMLKTLLSPFPSKKREKFYLRRLHIMRENLKEYTDFFRNLSKIPNSNGSAYFKKEKYKVAIITDEFMYHCFEECITLSYMSGSEETISEDVDFFIFVTCWTGMKKNDWNWVNIKGSDTQKRVISIIENFKSRNIPTIFYSIEDPYGFDGFLDIAKKSDYIFTTAEECIDRYRNECQNEKVHLLEFGINPKIHNPIGMKIFQNEPIIFAGSYIKNIFSERRKYLETFFSYANSKDIPYYILDRNFLGNSLTIMGEQYRFPKEVESRIMPAVEYLDLQKIHKMYNWGMNANSIINSNTMCAMRVYELQGLGRAIVSNYSPAVVNKFDNIQIFDKNIEFIEVLNRYKSTKLYDLQLEGIRNVYKNSTYFDRIKIVLEMVGLKSENRSRSVGIVLLNPESIEDARKQTYSNCNIVENIELLDIEKYDYICFLDSKNRYSEYYVEDMINGFKYTNSDFIITSKKQTLNYSDEHCYVKEIKDISRAMIAASFFKLQLKLDGICGNGYQIQSLNIMEN